MGIDLSSLKRKTTTVKLAGKDWTFTQITMGDFMTFIDDVKQRKEKERQKRKDALIQEAKDLSDVEAFKDKVNPMSLLTDMNKPITDDEAFDDMQTIRGLIYLAFLSLKHKYPEITFEDVQEMVSMDKVEDITVGALGDIAKGEGKKKQPRSRKKINRKSD